jgi:hypothetical protein
MAGLLIRLSEHAQAEPSNHQAIKPSGRFLPIAHCLLPIDLPTFAV